MLHDAAAYCGVLLLRPGKLDDTEEPAIAGEDVDRVLLMAQLKPALDFAWLERPAELGDLVSFLEEALDRLQAKSEEIAGDECFVPAAMLASPGRNLVFEHLKLELIDVLGGVETEDLWNSFDALDATAPIKQLTRVGLQIKMRSLGSFLLGTASHFDDEIAAAEFFPTGRWKDLRNANLCDDISSEMHAVNKLFAHLTLSRPLPEDREIYQPASYRPGLERLVRVFEEFTENVDERLLPDWWRGWFQHYRDDVAA